MSGTSVKGLVWWRVEVVGGAKRFPADFIASSSIKGFMRYRRLQVSGAMVRYSIQRKRQAYHAHKRTTKYITRRYRRYLILGSIVIVTSPRGSPLFGRCQWCTCGGHIDTCLAPRAGVENHGRRPREEPNKLPALCRGREAVQCYERQYVAMKLSPL